MQSYDQSVGGVTIFAAVPTKLTLLRESTKEKLALFSLPFFFPWERDLV